MRLPTLAFFALISVGALGCNSSSLPSCPGADCACSGASCICLRGKSCAWNQSLADGGNAMFQCQVGSTCSATCSGACNVACVAESSCTLDLRGAVSGECQAATCRGAIRGASSFLCAGGNCELTVGAASSVSCTESGVCTLTCEGACSVACSSNSTCRLKCASDAAFRTITEGATCT